MSRKRVPLNQNECTADFRIGVPFEQNLQVCNYEVTEYWNRALHKENLRSYGGRMKNQVTLADFYLLDINDGNKQFLSQFKQGINSNGKPRAPKIMVERDQFKNFAIAEMPLL